MNSIIEEKWVKFWNLGYHDLRKHCVASYQAENNFDHILSEKIDYFQTKVQMNAATLRVCRLLVHTLYYCAETLKFDLVFFYLFGVMQK